MVTRDTMEVTKHPTSHYQPQAHLQSDGSRRPLRFLSVAVVRTLVLSVGRLLRRFPLVALAVVQIRSI